ncbi:MAG TPA: serine protease [Candidatus Paceibacterota bacterium]
MEEAGSQTPKTKEVQSAPNLGNNTPVQVNTAPKTFWEKNKKVFFGGIGLVAILLIAVSFIVFMPKSVTKIPLTEAQILDVIRSEIIPSVVQLRCFDKDGAEVSTGTGIYNIDENGIPVIETNAHVVLGPDQIYYGCNIYFPTKEGLFYDSVYRAKDAFLYHTTKSVINGNRVDGIDYAILEVGEPYENKDFGVPYPFPPKQIALVDSTNKSCATGGRNILLGDKIYVIGYPDAGGDTLTLTEGIVSGFSGAVNEFIKVSASISFGNSGGVAIGTTDGCYYGIPSQIYFGGGVNIGQVLAYSFILNFIANSTGEKTYVPEVVMEDLSFYTDKTSGITLMYPKEWTVKENPLDDETVPVEFVAPKESVFDNYDESVLLQIIENKSNDSLQNYFKDHAAYLKENTTDFVVLGQFPFETNLNSLPGMVTVYHTGSSFVSEFLLKGNGQIFTIRGFLPDDDSSSTTYFDIYEAIAQSLGGPQAQKKIPLSFSNFNSLLSNASWPIFMTTPVPLRLKLETTGQEK